ncbi:MAG: 50S ribosomal protein L21 [Acidiferrobacterales bacterium]|nr:50S ribosomal protein L21 [Acidiferrobacterales bacterium]
MQLYAVIKSGDHEYRVTPGKVVNVDRLEAEPGQTIEFGEVSKLVHGDDVATGSPSVPGARVRAEVVKHGQKNGVIVFRMKRRRLYKDKNDQVYQYTALRIHEIVYGDEVFNKRDVDARRQKRIAAVKKPKRKKSPQPAPVAARPAPSAPKEPPKKPVIQQPAAEPVPVPAAAKPAMIKPMAQPSRPSRNRLPLVAAFVLLLLVASFLLFRSPSPSPTSAPEVIPVSLQDTQPVDRPIDPTQPPD